LHTCEETYFQKNIKKIYFGPFYEYGNPIVSENENSCPESRKVKRDDQSVEEYRNLVLAELKSITASGK
jgi:hypothetical protein